MKSSKMMKITGCTLLLFYVGAVHALFEEQAGLMDWHKANLGQVNHAEFAFRGRDRLFIGTKAGVVASLATQDGRLVWRQTLGGSSAVDDLKLVPRPAAVLSLSDNRTVIRAWQAIDGSLLWQRSVSEFPTSTGGLLVLHDIDGDPSSKIAVYSGKRIESLIASTGKRVWIKEDIGGEISSLERDDSSGTSRILVAVKKEESSYILNLDAKSGEQISSVEIRQKVHKIVLFPKIATALLLNGNLLSQEHGGPQAEPKVLDGICQDPVDLGDFVTTKLVSLRCENQLKIFEPAKKDSQSLSFPDFQLATAADLASHELAMGGISSQGALRISVYNAETQQTTDKYHEDLKLLTPSGKPLAIRSIFVGKQSAGSAPGYKFRILVEISDDSLWALEDGKVKWHSEEGLASIKDVYFVDLPASTAEAISSWDSSRPSLIDRLNAEVLTLKKALGYSQPGDDEQLKDITARMSTSLLPFRDTNGFRKLIVMLSSSGKIFGLHSGRGSPLWASMTDEGVPLTKLFPWQTPFDPAVGPKLLALGSADGVIRLVVVDAYSGKILSDETQDGTLIKVLFLPHRHEEKVEQQVLGFVKDDLTVQIWPQDAASSLPPLPLHFWVAQGSSVGGFKLESFGNPAVKLWESSQRSLLSIVAPDSHEPVYSYAKVLGNRDMKLKYLNSNLVFLMSGSSEEVAESSVNVQLIDTISGQVLYSQFIEGARGPATGVWSENWVVFTYYSTKNQRSEVSVLEFFEAQDQPLSIPSLLFGEQNTSYSSLSPPLLQVLQQSYWSQVGIKSLAVTSTRKGITSKQLLVCTDTDQVYLLDKRFVDPRRPRGSPPKGGEDVEILPPYSEELVFAPSQYATHRERVEGLVGVVTRPANLESTTLSVFYGLDIFFTRIQPSKTFDLLPDDFPYAMLVLVFVTLLVGSFVLHGFEQRKAISRKWI